MSAGADINANRQHSVLLNHIWGISMKKSDIINKVVDIADLSPSQADNAVSAIFEQITNALARGEAVNLVGFGSFSVKSRAERSGRNPNNGEAIVIPASTQPVFKPGKSLKDALNEK